MKYEDLFAGKTTFTVSNGKDEHYTYKVVAKYDKFFVNLLTGPDNSNSYTYIGMIAGHYGLVTTKASKMDFNSKPVKVFQFAERILKGLQDLPPGYSILPAGKCFSCGRKLTTPKSIETGYGPVCGLSK